MPDPISGSVGLTFSTAGSLVGKGRISGGTTLTFTTTGSIVGKKFASGAATLTFTTSSPTAKSKGILQGAASLVFAPAGSVKGRARIEGGATLAFSVVGLVSDSPTWESDEITWDNASSLDLGRYPVGLVGGSFIQFSPSWPDFGGQPIESFVERRAIPPDDKTLDMLVTEITPFIRSDVGCEIDISLGVQESAEDEPVWEEALTFTVGSSRSVDPILSGQLLAVRFDAIGQPHWRMSRYDLRIQPHAED